jgi:hypothetical protein
MSSGRDEKTKIGLCKNREAAHRHLQGLQTAFFAHASKGEEASIKRLSRTNADAVQHALSMAAPEGSDGFHNSSAFRAVGRPRQGNKYINLKQIELNVDDEWRSRNRMALGRR